MTLQTSGTLQWGVGRRTTSDGALRRRRSVGTRRHGAAAAATAAAAAAAAASATAIVSFVADGAFQSRPLVVDHQIGSTTTSTQLQRLTRRLLRLLVRLQCLARAGQYPFTRFDH